MIGRTEGFCRRFLKAYTQTCLKEEMQPARGTAVYGRLFEEFVVLELKRLLAYREVDWPLQDWRTAHGAEVDVVLETECGLWAVEIKSSAATASDALPPPTRSGSWLTFTRPPPLGMHPGIS